VADLEGDEGVCGVDGVGGRSGPAPCTSSATMEVSAHSPSPILKARRLRGRLPVAVVVLPDCVSTTGTVTSTDVPLMLSLPATSNLPPPWALMLEDSKMACGNWGTLNQTGLGSSASVSRAPMVALPVSTVKRMRLVASLAGSNASCASNFLKCPCNGTPIWRALNSTRLCAGSNCCCAWAGAAASSRALARARLEREK
jgi:hypothetical protein